MGGVCGSRGLEVRPLRDLSEDDVPSLRARLERFRPLRDLSQEELLAVRPRLMRHRVDSQAA